MSRGAALSTMLTSAIADNNQPARPAAGAHSDARSHASDPDPALLSAWHAHAEARQKKIAAAMAQRQQHSAPAATAAAPTVSRRPANDSEAQDAQRAQLEREQAAAATRRAALEAQLAKHHAYLDSLSGGAASAAPAAGSAAATRAAKPDFASAPSASGLLHLGSSTLLVSPPPANSYASAHGLPANDRSSRLEQPQPQQRGPPPPLSASPPVAPRAHATSDSFDAAVLEVDAAERYLAGIAAAAAGGSNDDDSAHYNSSSSPPTNHPSSSPLSNASAALSPAGPGTPTPRSTNSFGYDEFALSENVFVLSEKIRSGSGAPSAGHSRNASGSNSARKSGPGSLYARATPTRSTPASPTRTSFNSSPQPVHRDLKPTIDSASPGLSAYSTPSEVSPLHDSRNLSLNTSNVSKFYLPHKRANSGSDQANGNSNDNDWKEVDEAGADLFALAGVGMTEIQELQLPRQKKQQQPQQSQPQPRQQSVEQQPQRHQLDQSDTRPRAGRPPTRTAPSAIATAPEIDPTAPSTLNPFADRDQAPRDASPQHRLHGSPTASSLLRVKNAQHRAAQHRAYLDFEDQVKPKVLSPEQLHRLHQQSRSRSLSPPKQHPSATLKPEELNDPALSPLTNQALVEHVRADQYRPQNAGASLSRPTASSALRTRLTTEPPPLTKQHHTRTKSIPRRPKSAVVPVISVMPVVGAPARAATNDGYSHATRPPQQPPRPQTAAVRPPPAMPFSDMYAAVEAEEQARQDRERSTEATESNTADEWNTELDDQELDESETPTSEAFTNPRSAASSRPQQAAPQPAPRAAPKRAPAVVSDLDAESLMESQLLRLDSALELQKLRDEIHRLRNDSGHGALFAEYESTIAGLQKQNESLRTKLSRVECAPEMLRWVRSPTKRRGGDGQDDDGDDPVALPGAPASSVAKYRVLETSYRRAHEELAALHTAHNALRKKERLFTFQTKQLHLLETRLTESAAAANRKEKDLAALRTQLQSANVVNTELKTLVTDLAAKQSLCEDRLRRSVEQSLALKANVDSLQQALFDAKAASILGKLKVSPSSSSLRRLPSSAARFEGLDDLAELESIFKESRRPDAPPALVAAVSKKGLETLVRLRGRVELQAREHEATKANEKALLMTIMKMQEARKQ